MKRIKIKPISVALCVLLIVLAVPLIQFGSTLVQLAAIYTEAPFAPAGANKLAADVQSGRLKPNASGIVLSDVARYERRAYVTRTGGSLMVLIPSYMEHESNSFCGYLFVNRLLPSQQIVAYGPVRMALHGPKSFPMHLYVDRDIDAHWHHVHGELYK